MELGENEWITDIQKQARRLTDLTNDLVYLSRMEEAGDSMPMIEFPLSDVVSETAASFQTLAQTQGKIFQCRVQPMLSLTGNEKAIHHLVSILLDNALKYSPDNGVVSLVLKKQGKMLQLSVFNTTESTIRKENTNLLFERFYRMDSSRNSRTGGYGIGLSAAKAIVDAHGGKIQARTADGHSLQMIVTLPKQLPKSCSLVFLQGIFQIGNHDIKGGNPAFCGIPHTGIFQINDPTFFISIRLLYQFIFNDILCKRSPLCSNRRVPVHHKNIIRVGICNKFIGNLITMGGG